MKTNKAVFLNEAFFYGTIFFTVSGLEKVVKKYGQIELWLYIVFSFFLRLKIYFDDCSHFKEPEINKYFLLGTSFGILSWMCWGLSLSTIESLTTSYIILFVAISILSIWILIDRIKTKDGQHLRWLIFNVYYLTGIAFLLGWIPFVKINQVVVLLLLLIGLILDWLTSKSIDQFLKSA